MTIAARVAVPAAIALASASHATFYLGGPGLVDQVQRLGIGELSSRRVGRALVEPIVPVANIGEVVNLMRLG